MPSRMLGTITFKLDPVPFSCFSPVSALLTSNSPECLNLLPAVV